MFDNNIIGELSAQERTGQLFIFVIREYYISAVVVVIIALIIVWCVHIYWQYHLKILMWSFPQVFWCILNYFPDTICYAICHLKRFAEHPGRRDLTPSVKEIASENIVCDRFHFKNHTDRWCKKKCSPYSYASLEVCKFIYFEFCILVRFLRNHLLSIYR